MQANDAYLQMAIGNAPWPIGVTMVGIHARTGREKIFSKHVAHVLNDETQRKYIQVWNDRMNRSVLYYIYIYIYAFSRRFYPKRLTLHSSYSFYIFISSCFPWESNPWSWRC